MGRDQGTTNTAGKMLAINQNWGSTGACAIHADTPTYHMRPDRHQPVATHEWFSR